MGNEEAKPGEAETVEVLEVRRQIIGVYAFEEEVTQGLFTSWKVKFLVDGTISNYTSVHCPFGPSEEEDLRWYVEDFARFDPFEASRAEKVKASIPRYVRSLVQSLSISDILDTNSSIVLQIETNSECPQFHRLHWECLELLDYWPESVRPKAINVMRLIPTTISNFSTSRKHRVLIVSSRNSDRGSRDIPPRQVSHPAIRTLHKVNREFNVDIRADLVRPGTFEALRDQLEERGAGYYDLIHLDVHGSVNEYGMAHLHFFYPKSSPKWQRGGRLVTSYELAKLLQEFKIYNVITNACESGKMVTEHTINKTSDAGDAVTTKSISFAQGLVEQGAHNTAAMAFAVSAAAATVFIEAFYVSFFLQEKSFSNSVFSARRGLASQRRRPALFNTQVEICDSFVPVLFSSNPEEVAPVRMIQRGRNGLEFSLAMATFETTPEERTSETGEPDLVGRETELAELEDGFFPLTKDDGLEKNIIVIYGMLGTGKSTFAEHVCWWWKNSGVADDFVIVRTNPYLLGSPFKAMMENLQQKLSAKDMKEAISILRENRLIVLLDDINNLTQWSPLCEGPAPQPMEQFLTKVHGGRSIIILTSTCKENWTRAPVYWYQLGGLRSSDMDTCIAIMTSVMTGSGAISASKKGYSALEKIAELVSCNPSAIRTVCWGLDGSAQNAMEDHFVALRRGVTDSMAKAWSSDLDGYKVSRSAFKVKKFLEDCVGAAWDGGLLYVSLAMHSCRVHKDWIQWISNGLSRLTSDFETPLTAQGCLDMFNDMIRHLQDIGLLELSSPVLDHYEINPLFTYMARIKVQSGSLGSENLTALLKCAWRHFYAGQCFQLVTNVNPTQMRESMRILEGTHIAYFNLFDDLMEKEIDVKDQVMPTLDDYAANHTPAQRLLERLASGGLDDAELSSAAHEVESLFNIDRNDESTLFRILQLFMLQNVSETSCPFVDEAIDMCERYLKRVGLDASSSHECLSIPHNMYAPAIIATGWLAQYWVFTNGDKAHQYLDLGVSICDLGLQGKRENKTAMYYIYRAQLLLLKACIFMIRGNYDIARAMNMSMMELTLSEENEGVRELVEPYIFSLKFNASHALYNIEASEKGNGEAFSEEKAAVGNALNELANSVGLVPGDKFDNDEDVDIADLTHWVMSMWDMQGASESLGLKSLGEAYFESPKSTYFSRHGPLHAQRAVTKLREPSTENLKKSLQTELQSAIDHRDFAAAGIFSEALVELYCGRDNWQAACTQLVMLEEMRNQNNPKLFEGIQLACLTPAERMMQDLRNGTAFLSGARWMLSHDSFSNIITRREDCHKALTAEGVKTKDQMYLAKRLIRSDKIAEDQIQELCEWVESAMENSGREVLTHRLLESAAKGKEQIENAVEDVLELILLGISTYRYLGGLSNERFRESARTLIYCCRQLTLGCEEAPTG